MTDKKTTSKQFVLLTVTMASFLTPFIGSAINLALPSIGEQFQTSTYLLSWVATSYLLASAAFLVPIGRLADIIGRKKIFATGLGLFALSSLLCGLAWSIQPLLLFRVLQGIGSSMIFGTSMAILTSVFPPQERGKVLGINVATVYTGLSLGPVLGGVLNHNFGWYSIFYFTSFIALIVFIGVLTKLKGEWAGAQGEKFDLTGATLYSIGLVLFMYGFSSVTNSHFSKYLLVIGIAILIIFVWHEIKTKQPVLNLRLFSKSITFTFSNMAALINYSATYATGFLLSLYLQIIKGYDSQFSGLILLSQPVIMALLSPFTGRLSDHVEPRVLSSLGMGITTVGLIILYCINTDTALWLIVANLILLGVGFALFSSPNSTAVMGSVEKKYYGIASSTLATMRLVGQVASMAIVTLILTIYVGYVEVNQALPTDLLRATKTSFLVFSFICFIGIFASLARGSVNNKSIKSNKA